MVLQWNARRENGIKSYLLKFNTCLAHSPQKTLLSVTLCANTFLETQPICNQNDQFSKNVIYEMLL